MSKPAPHTKKRSRMADEENEMNSNEENELNSSNDKDEVKEDVSQSEEEMSTEKEDKATEPADTSPKEEKKAKLDKKEIKDEKNAKTEKSVKKESKKEEDDSEDEDDEEELPPGLLERPLEVEGKREKKKVERLTASTIKSQKLLEIEEGSGTKLGDISYVEHQVNITKAVDLKPLHRILFLRAGSLHEVKKNIKQFNGFTYSEDSKEHEKRVTSLNKMVMAELKAICVVLGLERSGTKGNLAERVLEFLMKPEDKGLKVKTKSKKRSSSTGPKTKRGKKKKTKETGKKGKVDKSDDNSLTGSNDEEDEEEEEAEAEEEEPEEEEDEEEEEEDSEYEAPKKKKAKTESKKKTPKKSAKENGKKEKPTPKETKKPAAKKQAVVDSDSLSEEEDSEDEPIAKMKKSPPSNEEIKALVKDLLNGADLEKVTMKTVVKDVYAKYPSFDLSDRKDLIKDTVREVIS